MDAITTVTNDNGLIFNQALFALAMVAFVLLLIIEKLKPYRHFSHKVYRESFVTNTTAFLINNFILN